MGILSMIHSKSKGYHPEQLNSINTNVDSTMNQKFTRDYIAKTVNTNNLP